MVPQEFDEEVNLAAAGNTDVGKCGVVVGRGRLGWMLGVGTVAAEEVGITAATLWLLLLLLLGLGLGGVGVLEVVCTVDVEAATLAFPVTI